jgi:hypothetical protein
MIHVSKPNVVPKESPLKKIVKVTDTTNKEIDASTGSLVSILVISKLSFSESEPVEASISLLVVSVTFTIFFKGLSFGTTFGFETWQGQHDILICILH